MKNNKYQYAVIQTLNGNFRLKELSKAEANYDSIFYELYGDSIESINTQFKEYKKELKNDGWFI